MDTMQADFGKAEAAYAALKDLIVNHHFPPGDHLHINELAERLNISVTPLREALIRLYGEALVMSQPNRGFFTKTFDLRELGSLYELALLILRHSLYEGALRFTMITADNPFSPSPNARRSDSRAEDLPGACAAFVEMLFERVVMLSSNAEMLKIIRNFNDRSHFVRVLDFENEPLRQAVGGQIVELVQCLEGNKREHAIAIIETLFAGKLERLPELMKEGLIRTYGLLTQAPPPRTLRGSH